MNASTALLAVIVFVFASALWLVATADVSEEERDEMLEDEEMWP